MSDCPRCGCPAFGFSSCYGHLKSRLLTGESLTGPERAFVGFVETIGHRGGWHSADAITFADLSQLLEQLDRADGAGRIVLSFATVRRIGEGRPK